MVQMVQFLGGDPPTSAHADLFFGVVERSSVREPHHGGGRKKAQRSGDDSRGSEYNIKCVVIHLKINLFDSVLNGGDHTRAPRTTRTPTKTQRPHVAATRGCDRPRGTFIPEEKHVPSTRGTCFCKGKTCALHPRHMFS